MWEHLDFWAMVFTLGAIVYFAVAPKVRPLFNREPPAKAPPVRSRVVRRRVPIRGTAGRLNGSRSVVTNEGNAVTTPAAPRNEAFKAPASDPLPRNDVQIVTNDVTWEEAARIGLQLAQNRAPSEIAKALPGYTPGKYKEFKAKVDRVKATIEAEEQAA